MFLDTASLADVREWLSAGVISGVTTNQKLFLQEGGVDFKKRVVDISRLADMPVSVETTAHGVDSLLAEAREYAGWNKNVVIKVAMQGDGSGLKVVRQLSREGIKTNMTVMVTFNQLYLAAKVGANYVSLFFNRARDAGLDPVKIIRQIVPVLNKMQHRPRLIIGSIRKPEDVEEAVAAGAHIVTITPKVLKQLPFHAKSEETIAEFDAAWKEFLKAEVAENGGSEGQGNHTLPTSRSELA